MVETLRYLKLGGHLISQSMGGLLLLPVIIFIVPFLMELRCVLPCGPMVNPYAFTGMFPERRSTSLLPTAFSVVGEFLYLFDCERSWLVACHADIYLPKRRR